MKKNDPWSLKNTEILLRLFGVKLWDEMPLDQHLITNFNVKREKPSVRKNDQHYKRAGKK
jgi:hypothetical protein